MKKTIIALACFLSITATSFAGFPNDKVLKAFRATFDRPREVKWTDYRDYYEVHFVQSQIRASVRYDLDGNFLSAVRYYTGRQLPANILCRLTSRYAGKTIFGVTEITGNESIDYFIKLVDNKHWITVRVTGNGEMTVVEKYKKA